MQKSIPDCYLKISRCTAVHEAGHAIAACKIGNGFHTVQAISMADFAAGNYIVDQHGQTLIAKGSCHIVNKFNMHNFSHCAKLRDIVIDSEDETVNPYQLIRESARQELIVLAAGAMAEAKYRHVSSAAVMLDGGSKDWQEMESIAQFIANDTADEHALLDKAEADARALFRNRKTWQAVLQLADEIQVQGIVTSDMAEPIIAGLSRSGRMPLQQ